MDTRFFTIPRTRVWAFPTYRRDRTSSFPCASEQTSSGQDKEQKKVEVGSYEYPLRKLCRHSPARMELSRPIAPQVNLPDPANNAT